MVTVVIHSFGNIDVESRRARSGPGPDRLFMTYNTHHKQIINTMTYGNNHTNDDTNNNMFNHNTDKQ